MDSVPSLLFQCHTAVYVVLVPDCHTQFWDDLHKDIDLFTARLDLWAEHTSFALGAERKIYCS